MKTSRFYYHSPDGVIGRKNDDGTFDSLMPDGTWPRGIPDMDEFVCGPVIEEDLESVASGIGFKGDVDFESAPVDTYDPETHEIVPFTSGS